MAAYPPVVPLVPSQALSKLPIDKSSPAHIEQTGEDDDKDLPEGQDIDRTPWDDLGVVQTLVKFRRAVFFTFLAANITFMEGFEIVISSSIIVNAGFNLQFGTTVVDGIPRVSPAWAWGAMVNVGQILSMLWVPLVANRFGRKYGLLCSWALMAISLGVATGARTPVAWLFHRLLSGMGLGVMQVLIVPYKIEIIPARVRGIVTVFGSGWSSVGGIVCSTMLQQLNKRYPLFWQLPIYIVWAPMCICLLCVLSLPETPWHYARRGDKEASVRQLRKINKGVVGYDCEMEYEVIQRTLSHEKAVQEANKASTWYDILIGPNKRRTGTVLLMSVANGFAGQGMMSSYNTYFFSFANLPDPFLGTVITTAIGLASLIAFAFMTDKLGRRLPICISYSMMGVSLWSIGGLYYAPPASSGSAILALACLWQASFVILGSAYYLLAAELPSAQLRVKTGALAFAAQACHGLTFNFVVPFMLTAIGLRSGLVFGAMWVPCAILVWLFLPETRGRTINEIDALFEARVPAWRWDKTKIEDRTEARIEGA